MGFEPTTLTLARLHSTTELFPQSSASGIFGYVSFFGGGQVCSPKKKLRTQKSVEICFNPQIGFLEVGVGALKLIKCFIMNQHLAARRFDAGEFLVRHLMKKDAFEANGWDHRLIKTRMNGDAAIFRMIGAKTDSALMKLRALSSAP